ncbi:MAG: choice-of-anchor C family protein [Haliscomenobacter sp.]|nr:choice-of-anchor C family protein [Haliscomenobacter sp.]
MDQEIARFDVIESAGKLQTSLPSQLRLPFNYIVLGDPGDRIHIFSKALTLLETLTLPESGKAGIKYSPADFQDKFMAYQKEEQFLEPFVFRENRPADLGKLNTRQFRTGKQTLQPKKGLVHNLTDHAYYQVQRVYFSDMQQSILVLQQYDARAKTAALFLLNVTLPGKKGAGLLALDYQGNLVYTLEDATYRLSKTGEATAADDAYVSPAYRFQDQFVQGGYWIVPVFAGVPMPKGSHTLTVSCKGKEENATSSETFNVTFDPQLPKFWRMNSPFNTRKDDTYFYYPTGIDPKSKLLEITIKECQISIDGKADLPYSYIDETLLKGISYTDWDTEEQKQQVLKAARENARRHIGFGGEGSAWLNQLNLFTSEQKLVNGEPLNMIEGPYPELRYQVWKVNGEYPDRKEAEKHCKTPYRTSSGKYQCREEVIVKICPDNFSVKMVDGRVTTDYEALQCGTATPVENTAQGEEIVVEFSKAGYITETRALSLRTLEAGEILLSGQVRDDQGVELEGVQVKLRKLDGLTQTDKAGIYNLIAKAQGKAPHSETMDIKLKKIGIEISHEELGIYEGKPWGIVSDGFTTLELKVKANGIRPNTVSVKQPELGQFVEKTMLKVPLVLNGAGEGFMEYVPPEYLTNEQLNVQLPLSDTSQAGAGMGQSLWAAEVPVRITYEDEQGKPGVMEFRIYVTRPPVFLIHGFTGNETTWADLGVFLRARKFNALIYEYYQGPVDESTIPRQSQKLGQYIQDVRKCYKTNGFYQTRIDIVAHSMGGLISRHYISNMAKYGEKAGIVIPYNVKLSHDELAAQRFQKPVIMNDVRKLIMVGTPNHGSSFIDGTIGHLCAIMDDNHQLANAQLRSNSPFITELNAGEREGRHLSPNVQYALLYGIRRVSPLYPPDALGNYYAGQAALLERPLAHDDGVVTIESARLNGVIDFHFPQERTIYSNSTKYHFHAPVGFIHSPATNFVFQGDKSITTSEEVFNKATELLLEDIPRAPLKNAYARIIQAEGKASMRYFSHHDWQAIAPGARTQLENPWCYFQTGEGSLSIGFFLDGRHWASLHLQPHTVLQLEHAAPEFVQIYLQEGKARFRSRKQGGGGFEVVMGEETEQWYTFNPKARVNDLQTDFIIEAGDELTVQSLSGQVLISIPQKEKGQAAIIGSAEGKRITAKGALLDYPLPASGWWTAIDASYLPDETAEPAVEAPDTTRTNLAANGSFEEGPDFSRYIVLHPGDSIPGWTVVAGTVDITDESYQPSEGKRSLDLLGTTRVGSIRQTIATAPGQYYLVQFDLAGNPLAAHTQKLLEVAAAGQSRSFTFSIEGKSPQNMGWETRRFVFAAAGDSTALVFTGNDPEGPGGAGPMIDHVRVFAISEEEALRIMEEDQPIQPLGEVATEVSTPVLPVGSFTQLRILARNDEGDPLVSPYEVKVDLENAEHLAFININSANQVIDAQGQYAAHITISEPDPQLYTSLSEIPLEATFRVQLIHPRSKKVQYDKKTTLPLGMTLLHGTTLGPDYQPRQEPVPPEFYETRYQLANQNDAMGNFYILFNTTLFEEDIERFRQHADRTQKIFSMEQFDFYLEWLANCSAPLRYVLPDSILHQLKAGRQVKVGKNGYIDLLSPQEHEGRIKAQVSRFVEAMPLEAEAKSRVIQQLNRITFRYSSAVRYPTFFGHSAALDALEMPPAATTGAQNTCMVRKIPLSTR